MKCPRCSHDNALLLLDLYLCINFGCDNFDAQHSMEFDRKQALLNEPDPLEVAIQKYLNYKLQDSFWWPDES